ncbi:MAG TPA: hypothetical protein VNM24_11340 [Burkholderiales bacterium]|nr:hypothetical protein [Burkholderiales bacterium]
MANHKSDYAKGVKPMPIAKGSEIVSVRMEVVLPATHAVNDILEFGELPEDHVPVDAVFESDDIDTNVTPAVVLDFGLLNSAKTAVSTDADDGGAAWLSGATIGQSGTMARPTARALWKTKPKAATRRMIGAKIATGAATAAAGSVFATVHYRAAHYSA